MPKKYPDKVFLIYAALQNMNRQAHSYTSVGVLEFPALYIIIYTQRPSNQGKNKRDNKKKHSLFHIFKLIKRQKIIYFYSDLSANSHSISLTTPDVCTKNQKDRLCLILCCADYTCLSTLKINRT